MTDDDRAIPLACELAGQLREAARFFTPLNIDIAQEVMRSAGRIEQVAKRGTRDRPSCNPNVIERVYRAISEDALTNSSDDDSLFLAPLRKVQNVD